MRWVSYVLPPAYVFEGMRRIVSGGAFSSTTLLWSNCLAVAYVVLAALFFTRIYHQAVRTGLIARYSSESIS
jgi:ABC-2 type transport system permease protein